MTANHTLGQIVIYTGSITRLQGRAYVITHIGTEGDLALKSPDCFCEHAPINTHLCRFQCGHHLRNVRQASVTPV